MTPVADCKKGTPVGLDAPVPGVSVVLQTLVTARNLGPRSQTS